MGFHATRMALVFSLLTLTPLQAANSLPDIGTAGVSAMSVEREALFGQAFTRFARANQPVSDDPVLNEYVTDLGLRLLSQADSVRFPFQFLLIRDDSINASAFLGGVVQLHTGLFLYAENESELASVIAHEITHVTQRHIARYLESQSRSTPLTIAGLVGSVALAVVNPQAGMAALQTTLGLKMQSAINYTRDNEFEADRIGLRLLYNAGFDPNAMASFFQKLADKYQFASTPPPMLLTHPLPTSRIAEARSRAQDYPAKIYPASLEFQLAKARIMVRFQQSGSGDLHLFFEQAALEGGNWQADAARYGQAMALLQNNEYDKARPLLEALASRHVNNIFILDALTDLDNAQDRFDSAIARLQRARQQLPDNQVVMINLADSLLQAGRHQDAATLLDNYLRRHPENLLAWELIAQAYRPLSDESSFRQAQAEVAALKGRYDLAVDQMEIAANLSKDAMQRARLGARLEQLRQQQKDWDALRN
ncbi:beta-barrel assembly-enhancing protease [Oceanisphaera arctica]|uniref:Putative beta-barrel assembly-enhancing protease n=1 Tax=Oceanisphaera arctica TaxID=641510 RepID=A0A2P5TQ59_9GAMM|nr:M48 family metalloprotease [Oceanisphaera arctica]PPL17861.1 peptidase M48 [Oceanisphaera arctica]GHA23664.1 putative beta-barrel assembly-enhancing protease [Oceanisphaera arctica]